jgi:hypothetical protein
MQSTATATNNTPDVRFLAGKVQQMHKLADGTSLVLHLSGSSTGSRRWGIWRTLRVLRIYPGVVYQSSRSKGVEALWAREFDERSDRSSTTAKSEGEQVYVEAVARDRLAQAQRIAAEVVASL